MWRRLLAAGLLGLAAPALAGPFAEVGDRQLRQDVALLSAEGLIDGPVDSWPLPWAQIDAGLMKARDGRDLPPHVRAAVNRLDRLSGFASQEFAVEARLMGTNSVSVPRDFGTLARAKGDASGRIEVNTDTISVSVGAGVRLRDPTPGQNDPNYLHFEPSQVAIRLGNWALYGGYTEQFWGPGVDGALLWSNSARPFPKIGIKRLLPTRINFPVLRWLGPTQFEIFGGVLNGPRRDFRNILTFGTRLSFAPARGLQIGLNRAQMLCGDGRPCGFRQITSSFIGIGNADNPTPGDPEAFLTQAGNQLAGWDISYTHRFGATTAKVYVEAEAEDFDNVILEQYSRMVGATVSGPWGRGGAMWTATLEYADTQAASLFNSIPGLEQLTGGDTIYPISMYNNSLYFDGFTYRGRPIGYWTDGDSRNLAAHFALTDTRNRRWYASVRSVHLNLSNLGNPPQQYYGPTVPAISYRVSTSSEKFAVLTAGAELPTRIGDIRIEGRFQTDSPSTPGFRQSRGAIEVQLRERF